MLKRIVFSAQTLVVVAASLAVCWSCSSGDSGGPGGTASSGGPGGGPGGDGGPGGSGGDAAADYDAGPKPYGTIPPAPVITYTCSREIHVSMTGSDANDGSVANPMRTISKATPLAKAGECVKVHAGTYAEGASIAFAADGTADKPIVLVSADGRGTAIIDAAANHTTPVINVTYDHVVIDGFEIKNAPSDTGLHVVRFDGTNAGKCAGSVLRGTKIAGGFTQVKVYQKTGGVIVENNEFSGKTANVAMGLTGASGLVFRANYCHDWNTGDNGAVQLTGASKDVLFEKNLFQDVTSPAGVIALGDNCGPLCDSDPEHFAAQNARAVNNVLIRVVRAFDVLGCKNCAILSNTIIDSADKNLVFRLGAITAAGAAVASTGTRILDNMLTSPRGTMEHIIQIDGAAGQGLQMDYNLYWDGPWYSGVPWGETHPATADMHSVLVADPLLMGAMDLRPSPQSPAVGKGTNLGTDVQTDFLGVPRPAGVPDIGAYQH